MVIFYQLLNDINLFFNLQVPKLLFEISIYFEADVRYMEIFYYNYPFSLPNIFQTKLTKDQLEVRFKFIQVFSSVNIEKVFFIQEFLSSYSSVISNQRKNNSKKYFIQLVQLFKEYDSRQL